MTMVLVSYFLPHFGKFPLIVLLFILVLPLNTENIFIVDRYQMTKDDGTVSFNLASMALLLRSSERDVAYHKNR